MQLRTAALVGLIALSAVSSERSICIAQAEEKSAKAQINPAEARSIAKDAYIYGFPLVDSYRVQYSYFVNRDGAEFKAPWNQLHSEARVYTAADKAIQTPNSDTPYSQLGADLRGEPLVLTVPAVDPKRYYSLQFVDLYTFNFAYVGSRATGNEAGSFLLAGPSWKGETPAGIKSVIRSETDFVLVLYRTQLFRPDDIDNVKKVQAGYKVQTLSSFLGQPAPAAPPAVEFMKPLTPEQQRTSLEFFGILNFVLQFCPVHPAETELRAKFGKLGIGTKSGFDPNKIAPEIAKAMEEGMADAWKEFARFKATELDTGKKTSADCFGTREFLSNDFMARMAAAVIGIYGNSKQEAMYPVYFVDGEGASLDAAKHKYILHFPPDQLPPVNAFWSLTMYELPSSLLSANPLNRYLINSPMLPDLVRDPDGGLTLYLQHEAPAKDQQPNWLPAPKGPFVAVLRLYWPKPSALEGQWKAPALKRVD